MVFEELEEFVSRKNCFVVSVGESKSVMLSDLVGCTEVVGDDIGVGEGGVHRLWPGLAQHPHLAAISTLTCKMCGILPCSE